MAENSDSDGSFRVHLQRTNDAHMKIADYLGCDKNIVDDVLDWLPSPFYSGPEKRRILVADTKIMNDMSTTLKRLATLLESGSEKLVHSAKQQFDVHPEKVREMSAWLEESCKLNQKAPNLRSARGGKNLAAYDVASGVAQIFERLKRPISFGHLEGLPTTDFGRSVVVALEAFSISSNWRGPAHEAWSNTKLKEKK